MRLSDDLPCAGCGHPRSVHAPEPITDAFLPGPHGEIAHVHIHGSCRWQEGRADCPCGIYSPALFPRLTELLGPEVARAVPRESTVREERAVFQESTEARERARV